MDAAWLIYKQQTEEWIVNSCFYGFIECCPGHAMGSIEAHLIVNMDLDVEVIVAMLYERIKEWITKQVTDSWIANEWEPVGIDTTNMTLESEIQRCLKADMDTFMKHARLSIEQAKKQLLANEWSD